MPPTSRLRGEALAPGEPLVVGVGVNNGDAFLGALDDYRFLVDGGDTVGNARLITDAASRVDRGSRPGFPMASHSPGESQLRLNVVVCTHSDRDHANGVLGVLRASQRGAVEVEELWLPAYWCPIAAQYGSLSSDALATRLLGEFETTQVAFGASSLGFFDGADAESDSDEADGFLNDGSSLATHAQAMMLSRGVGRLRMAEYLAALSRIDLITQIVAAGRRVASIIWWDYSRDLALPSARHDFRGLNCFETSPPSAVPPLTTVARGTNERSLVFAWCPPGVPPALFTADSPLNFPSPMAAVARDGMLATAAHHGSPTNAATFAFVTNSLNDPSRVLWLRGSYKGQAKANYPSSEFLRQPRRACVELPCRQATRDVLARCTTAGWDVADPNLQCPSRCPRPRP